jgi:hypothetical protein
MSIRDLKKRSRLALHDRMSFPAYHVDLDAGTESLCSIRHHERQGAFGDMAGFDYAPVERVEITPRIVVLAAEVSAKRGDVFSVSASEAYEVETVMPPDGITVTIEVTRMRQSEIDAAALPVPD